MNKDDFVKVNSKFSIGSSKVENSGWSIGDFLSRIWANYGPPDGIQFEGFEYTFKHIPSGLVFTAYSAGSGPAYGGRSGDKENLIPVIDEFKKLLELTTPVDCEIKYDADYGEVRVGFKNGQPFGTSEGDN